jgi:Protein of unknown function (DUF2924)
LKNTAPSMHDILRTSKISEKLHALSNMNMTELWALWDQFFVHRPARPNRTHIESRLSYKLQEQAYGALPTSTRDMLADYGTRFSKIKTTTPSTQTLLPGTTLMREFDGQKYKVTVLPAGGYEFDGQRYKSLSAIAKLITGTQWSGLAFFGLKGKKA